MPQIDIDIKLIVLLNSHPILEAHKYNNYPSTPDDLTINPRLIRGNQPLVSHPLLGMIYWPALEDLNWLSNCRHVT